VDSRVMHRRTVQKNMERMVKSSTPGMRFRLITTPSYDPLVTIVAKLVTSQLPVPHQAREGMSKSDRTDVHLEIGVGRIESPGVLETGKSRHSMKPILGR
ncbi:hypothetical protein FRC15_007232, partial [Serendipita sp. 397]